MSRMVDREYLVYLLNQYYLDQENNCYFCFETSRCKFCTKAEVLEHQFCMKKFNGINANFKLWLVSCKKSDRNIITIKPVL